MANARSEISPLRPLSPSKSVYTRLIHTTDHTRHMSLLAQWHTTFLDILKEFGKR